MRLLFLNERSIIMKKSIKIIFSIPTLKTLFTVFVFVSWCVSIFVGNTIALSIFLFIGVFCANASFSRYTLCKALLGVVFFLLLREIFLLPIPLSKPFTWWNQQSACCGTISVLVSTYLVEMLNIE